MVMFYGNAISLYGVTSFDHGVFSVTIDGVPTPYALNASAPPGVTRYQQLLVRRPTRHCSISSFSPYTSEVLFRRAFHRYAHPRSDAFGPIYDVHVV